MLSRRSVRVKVMQILYALNRDPEVDAKGGNTMYWQRVDQSFDLLVFNVFTLMQICKVALEDEEKRKSKHLPTEEDKTFTAKLADNELIRSLRDNSKLNSTFEKKGFLATTDKDQFKKIYYEFAKEETYQNYLKGESERQDHIDILLELFRFCRKNELYSEIMDDHFTNWLDDKSLVVGSIKKIFKSLPDDSLDLKASFYPDNPTVKEYGEELLAKTLSGNEHLESLIVPLLNNWDQDRVAIIDMIILKMAATEFLAFPTIPTVVTLNEYVDVSKNYSTDKSKEFVNGVLDTLMKKLESEGQIEKIPHSS